MKKKNEFQTRNSCYEKENGSNYYKGKFSSNFDTIDEITNDCINNNYSKNYNNDLSVEKFKLKNSDSQFNNDNMLRDNWAYYINIIKIQRAYRKHRHNFTISKIKTKGKKNHKYNKSENDIKKKYISDNNDSFYCNTDQNFYSKNDDCYNKSKIS